MFRRRDVHTLLAIKELLHVQRFTIAGARQALRSMARGEQLSIPPIPAVVETAAQVSTPEPVVTAKTQEVVVAPRGDDVARHEPHVQVEIVGLDAQALRENTAAQLVDASGEPAVEVDAIASDAPLRRRRKQGQLGFGFERSDRELLLKARADLQELLMLVEETPANNIFA